MSVPINSDGISKHIHHYMTKGWTPAEQYISKFLIPTRNQMWEVIRGNPGIFRPPKPPNQQIYDSDSCPVIAELPEGYALLTNASTGGTLGIFGHPSGQSFRNALDFLPHFQWLGSKEINSIRCSCRLCQILYQEDEFIRQTTNLAQSPTQNAFISPFSLGGLQISIPPSIFSSQGASASQSGNLFELNGDDYSPVASTNSPLELFPSHISNLSQIPLQQPFDSQLHAQLLHSFSANGNGIILQNNIENIHQNEVQNNLVNLQQFDFTQLSNLASPQAPEASPIQREETSEDPRTNFKSKEAEYSHVLDKVAETPKDAQTGNNTSTSKPSRKPRAKKAKTPPAVIDTPRASSFVEAPIPETPDISLGPSKVAPNYVPRPEATSPGTPAATAAISAVMSEESKLNYKVLQLQANNTSLEKDIGNLLALVKKYEKRLERLKFERRLLLETIHTRKKYSKRIRDDTSDSVGTERDVLGSEILQREDDGHIFIKDDLQDKLSKLDSSSKKKRRKKRIKLLDPNAPKRPANAFIMFCDLQRASVNYERRILQKRDPESEEFKSMGQLSKALGAKWRNLSEEERKEYQDIFHEQVEWYDVEIKEYMAVHPNAVKEGSTEELPDDWTDLNAPKRPANPFFVFCETEDEQIKLAEESGLERFDDEELERISLALITRWRALSEEKRQYFIQEYDSRLAAYSQYMSKETSLNKNEESENDDEPEGEKEEMEHAALYGQSPRLDQVAGESGDDDIEMDVTSM